MRTYGFLAWVGRSPSLLFEEFLDFSMETLKVVGLPDKCVRSIANLYFCNVRVSLALRFAAPSFARR